MKSRKGRAAKKNRLVTEPSEVEREDEKKEKETKNNTGNHRHKVRNATLATCPMQSGTWRLFYRVSILTEFPWFWSAASVGHSESFHVPSWSRFAIVFPDGLFGSFFFNTNIDRNVFRQRNHRYTTSTRSVSSSTGFGQLFFAFFGVFRRFP